MGDDIKIIIKYIACSVWNSLVRIRRIQWWAFWGNNTWL